MSNSQAHVINGDLTSRELRIRFTEAVPPELVASTIRCWNAELKERLPGEARFALSLSPAVTDDGERLRETHLLADDVAWDAYQSREESLVPFVHRRFQRPVGGLEAIERMFAPSDRVIAHA